MVTRMCHRALTHRPITYKIIRDQSVRHYELCFPVRAEGSILSQISCLPVTA